MNINNIIKNRRTIRKFKTKKVPKEIINKILEAARWAPSVYNLQPWKFMIVESEAKKKLVDVLKSRPGKEVLLLRLILKSSIELIESVPVVILVYNNSVFSNKLKKMGKFFFDKANIYETQSIACAMQNMLLAAHSLGLGISWLGAYLFRERQINKLLGVKDKLMAILALGYPDKKPSAPSRKPISEIAIFRK